MDEIWHRIDSWLASNAPPLAAAFGPPATSREVAKTEQYLGVQFPADVRASYRRHNGHWSLLAGWEWYSLEGIRHSWTVWKDLLTNECFAGKKNSAIGSKVSKDWWNPAWIPLFHLESDEICLDFAPGPKGTSGQIIEMWHDEGQRPVVAPNFRKFLSDYADDLEAGKLIMLRKEMGEVDESGELDRIEWLRATLMRRGRRRNQDGWEIILNLARQFGWMPSGTRPPPGIPIPDWDASIYILHEGQEVTEVDAAALASAIGRALATIAKGDAAKPPEGAAPELAYFTGYNRRKLAEFAKYCKGGGFRVID